MTKSKEYIYVLRVYICIICMSKDTLRPYYDKRTPRRLKVY